MKILLLVPLWKRPEIVRLFIWRMEAVIPDYAKVYPLFILSPEDPTLKALEKITEGYQRFYFSNEYLGDKLNAGLTYAMRFEWDYLMNMGSDNIYTDRLWQLYEDYFRTGEPYFSLNECYFYDLVNNRAWYQKDYVSDAELGGIGAGRMIHRSLIGDDPKIWRTGTCTGMDGFSAWSLYQRGGHMQKIVQANELPVMLDIKTNTNINHSIEVFPQRTKDVPVQFVIQEFGLYDSMMLDGGAYELISFEQFHTEVLRLSSGIRKEDAFNTINTRYEMAYGEKRYKNIDSYYSQVSKKSKQ